MKKHKEVFEGVISSVTSFGMFVELDNTVEGLVRISNTTMYIMENSTALLGKEPERFTA